MEFIGQYLKSVRSEKKIQLKSVSTELKISLSLLQDIEKDIFPEYIDKVFIIGHIRSYAKYLNLNHYDLIENFKIQTSYYDYNSKKEISKPITNKNLFSIPKSLSYFSIIIFASGFYFLFLKTDDFQNEYAMTPDIPENLISKIEKMEMNISLAKISDNKNKDLISSNQKNILENELDMKLNSSSVVASLSNNQDLQQLNEIITLRFLNPTWIQLRDLNDEIVFSKLMDKGDEYFYGIDKNFNLTAGNAGNIIVLIDNKVVGKAGKPGEIIDSLIINQSFNQ